MKSSISDTVFYHIYPLGMDGCPVKNDFSCPAGNTFEKFTTHLDKIKALGCNALYIGPLFESTGHGYDTVDYYHVDRRLGNNQKFKDFCNSAHNKGFKIILDAVLNHTGRDFFAFKDIQNYGRDSKYKNWYKNLNFDRKSCYGDDFDYDGWAGCMDLVKLNVDDPEVRNHLFGAVKFWHDEFGIDGLRLDAADVLSPSFLDALRIFCDSFDPDFWLMGEVVHGNYNNWAHSGRLDSVTNYEVYKGLWSSFNSLNFFEIAYSLNRQFGVNGLYKSIPLYNFVDNHDVNRIASTLTDLRWLFPLYGLLFTIPGIPSIYYGSEAGIQGKRNEYDDRNLRPYWDFNTQNTPDFAKPAVNSEELKNAIHKFSKIRSSYDALKKGNYTELAVSNRQFAFMREFYGQQVIVAVNSEFTPTPISLNKAPSGIWEDVLNGNTYTFNTHNEVEIPSSWLRILVKKGL